MMQVLRRHHKNLVQPENNYFLYVFVAGDECSSACSLASTNEVSEPECKLSRIGLRSAVGGLDQPINLRVLDLSENKLTGENDACRQTIFPTIRHIFCILWLDCL